MARTSFTLIMLCVAGAWLSFWALSASTALSLMPSRSARAKSAFAWLWAHNATSPAVCPPGSSAGRNWRRFGVGAAFRSMRFMSSILFKVSPMDPWTYSLAAVVIFAISWIACYLPPAALRKSTPSTHFERSEIDLKGRLKSHRCWLLRAWLISAHRSLPRRDHHGVQSSFCAVPKKVSSIQKRILGMGVVARWGGVRRSSSPL